MEREVGIRAYLTSTPGIGGRLKVSPEDFVVEEIPGDFPRAEDGEYVVATVTARNWETNRLVREMARRLGVSRKRIRFAGTKDKRAVTTRLMQFDVPLERLRALNLKDVALEGEHRTDRRLRLGDLRGNRFRLVVRHLTLPDDEAGDAMEATYEAIAEAGGFPNFFGVQRFGEVRPVTHLVGRAIVAGDFKAAVDAYVATPIEGEPEDAFEARAKLQDSGDYGRALRDFPDRLGFEKAVLNALAVHPDDYVGALRALPFNLQLMFVHAFQGYLFNRVLSLRMIRGLPLSEAVEGDVVLPLDQWGSPAKGREIPVTSDNIEKVNRQLRTKAAAVSGPLLGSESARPHGEPGALEEEVFGEEGVKEADFVVPEMVRLSSRGGRRPLVAGVSDLQAHMKDGSAVLTFQLPRGAYATCLLREFMKSSESL